MEEEVLDEDSIKEADRGRGSLFGMYEEAGSTEYESGKKIAGQESSPCSKNTTCSVGKACMKIPRKNQKMRRQQ